MKHLLLTTIAAVLVVGCGESQQSAPTPESKPAEPVAEPFIPGIMPHLAKAPDISIHDAAARTGTIEAVKQYLAAGEDVNAKDEFGFTPLLHAAARGHKEIVELLIAEGADVNAKDDVSGTPLHLVDNKEIAELLIAKGGDVNAERSNGETPLDWATIFKKTEIADLLRKHGGKHGVIIGAAAGGDAEAVKEFLDAGTDVNAKDKGRFSTLHFAVGGGHTEIVELLITKGADVNVKDDGVTPLHFAARHGHEEIVELLITKGADVNVKDDGVTPLHFAALNGRKVIVELLIAKGADVNAKDGGGDTPLDWAIDFKKTEVADLLRKHGGKTKKELKAGDNELAAKPKVTSFKSMPEIDLASFTEEQQATILAQANKEGCDCGCKMTVAECRNDDTSCRTSVRLAKIIVEEVTGEKPNSESKADGGKTGEELKAEDK
jgi:ankyrin repeat protein